MNPCRLSKQVNEFYIIITIIIKIAILLLLLIIITLQPLIIEKTFVKRIPVTCSQLSLQNTIYLTKTLYRPLCYIIQ